jgi:hypothetical protein
MNRLVQIPLVALTVEGILVFLISCAPYRVAYLEESLRHATQSELIHKFGYPQRLRRVKNGDQVWEYDFQGKDSECASYAITFDAEDQLRHWERRECGALPGGMKAGE